MARGHCNRVALSSGRVQNQCEIVGCQSGHGDRSNQRMRPETSRTQLGPYTQHLKFKGISGLILLPGEMSGNLPGKAQSVKCHLTPLSSNSNQFPLQQHSAFSHTTLNTLSLVYSSTQTMQPASFFFEEGNSECLRSQYVCVFLDCKPNLPLPWVHPINLNSDLVTSQIIPDLLVNININILYINIFRPTVCLQASH